MSRPPLLSLKGKSHRPLRILLVDDDPGVCRSLASLLAAHGYVTEARHDGAAAISELGSGRFQLVLLDLAMPGVDGFDVLRHISEQQLPTAVIIVSGEDAIEKALRAVKLGADDFIRKPFNPDELLLAVRNTLARQQLHDENRRIAEQLKESETLHRFLVHNSPDLLYMLDNEGRFTFVNDNLSRHLGYRKNEVLGKHYSLLIHQNDRERADYYFSASRLPKNMTHVELRLQGKNPQQVRHAEVTAIQVERTASGKFKLRKLRQRAGEQRRVGTYGVARDVTDRKRSEEIIRFQNHHDLLTGLPNRSLFNDRATMVLNHARRRGTPFAVLHIDIDRFRRINDSLGQMVGDELLQGVAESLRRCVRDEDTLARFGGDEFVILLPHLKSPEDARTVAEKILEETAAPYRLQGHEIQITLSVGIAIYPEHGDCQEELTRNANMASSDSRSLNSSTYAMFHKGLQSISGRAKTEALLRAALRNDGLEVYYQPQIDLQSGRIASAEALVRMRDSKGALLLPDSFIRIAEESNLIHQLGSRVLEIACQDSLFFRSHGVAIPLSINISAQQFALRNFSAEILETLKSFGLPADQLELEITENVIIQNMDMTLRNIVQLARAGVRIAIDDFGKGYSSLSYLDQLPLNTLKLDKSFIRKICKENGKSSIIPAIISVAQGLDLNFIAEGIETREQHNYLTAQGAAIVGQGFFYSQPLPRTEVIAFAKEFRIAGSG